MLHLNRRSAMLGAGAFGITAALGGCSATARPRDR